MTQAYTTELTVEQYELLDSLLPHEAKSGRPRTVDLLQKVIAQLGGG